MSEQTQAELHAIAYGRVQGVNFRQFVVQRARERGLTGFVRNLPDGRSLEVTAAGPRELLNELLRLVETGPTRAQVEHVEVVWTDSPPGAGFPDFQIRY